MTDFPKEHLHLGGMALAHSLFCICDDTASLVPLAFVATEEGMQLIRFEADTLEEGVLQGKAHLEESNYAGWALAYEGFSNGEPAMIVEIASGSVPERITAIQPYSPFVPKPSLFGKATPFRLRGKMMVAVDQVAQSDPALAEEIMNGVANHPKAAKLWKSWAT